MEDLSGGRVLGGRYRADRLLGRGGMGEVWLCRDLERDADVAVKVMRPDVLRDGEAARLFHGEVIAAARLCHRGIIAVYDLLSDEGEQPTCLVMEYRAGHSLSDHVPEIRDFGFVCEVLRQVLSALAYAHAHAVLHLDIKPDNVLLEARGDALRTTLLDFGIARIRTPGAGIERWLHRDTVMGTLAYMAPEQCGGMLARFGPWTDLYAVGAMGYEMCAGHPPFDAVAGPRAIFQRMTARAPRLEPVIEGVPTEFVDLCAILLATAPSERPTHAADVLVAIEAMAPRKKVIPGSRPVARRHDSAEVTALGPETRATAVADAVAGHAGEADGGAKDGTEGDRDGWSTVAVEALTAARPERVEVAATLAVPADPRRREAAFERASDPLASGAFSIDSAIQRLDDEFDTPEPEPGAYGLFGLRQLPMVGREDVRRAVWRALRASVLEGCPRLVLLEGPAGSGKSRVARDAMERSHELGLCSMMQTSWSAEGSGDEGLRGLVENLLDSRGATPDGLRSRLAFWLERCPGDHAAFTREVQLLLRPPVEAAPDANMPLRVVMDALERACAQRPVLLWLDDVQHSRGQANALLAALAERDWPVCVVATAREEEIEDRSRHEALLAELGEGRAARVGMPNLDVEATRSLVRGLLDVDAELCDFLAARAEGNPLFVTQLLTELVDAEAVSWREGHYRASPDFDLAAVPSDIGALWARRVERSGADPRHLGALALVRDRVPVDVAAELGRALEEDLTRAIRLAVEHGLLVLGAGSYGWTHGLLRDHLISRVEPSDRARFALSAARALEPLVGLEDVQEERARHLLDAGAREAACVALLEAIEWSERRAELPEGRARADLLIGWSEANSFAEFRARALAERAFFDATGGDAVAASAGIQQAVAAMRTAGLEVARVYVRHGQIARRAGRTEEGIEATHSALRVAVTGTVPAAEGLLQLGIDAHRRGEEETARRLYDDAADAFMAARRPEKCGRALAYLALLDGGTDVARYDRALALAVDAGALSDELVISQMRADALFNAGRAEEARAEAARLAEEAQRRGLRQLAVLTHLEAGRWAVEMGEWEEADRHRARGQQLGARTGSVVERAFHAALDLVIALQSGCSERASAALAALEQARQGTREDSIRRLLAAARRLAPPGTLEDLLGERSPSPE